MLIVFGACSFDDFLLVSVGLCEKMFFSFAVACGSAEVGCSAGCILGSGCYFGF